MQLHAGAFDVARPVATLAPHVIALPRPRAIETTAPQPPRTAAQVAVLAPAPRIPPQSFTTLDFNIEADTGTFWSFMRPEGRTSFTPGLIADLARLQSLVRNLGAAGLDAAGTKLRFLVLGSRTPGIFNLGGDLSLFARCIRTRDGDTLRAYGHACVRGLHDNTSGYDAGAVSIALVQGDALGGGFECALSFDMIIAERQARMGFPEILFNLFPGMGAYSYLARRIAPALAERMILSGRIHTAEELYALGVVDMVVEPGQGTQAVAEFVARQGHRHNAHSAVCQVRRRVNPVDLQELLDVVDIWVDTALNLDETDLRKMERLAAAQERRSARPHSALDRAAC
jgi:DSF synthase